LDQNSDSQTNYYGILDGYGNRKKEIGLFSSSSLAIVLPFDVLSFEDARLTVPQLDSALA
jgi:hypothetical protein